MNRTTLMRLKNDTDGCPTLGAISAAHLVCHETKTNNQEDMVSAKKMGAS